MLKTGENLCVGGGNDWNTCFRDILADPWGNDSIDVVATDPYPGTWCCGSNYRDWGALDTLLQIACDFGKEAATMETGFSTFDEPDNDQDNQDDFVNDALDEILTKTGTHNRQYPASAVQLTSWHELKDACTGCWTFPRQEPNFGIMMSNPPWGAKLAYDDLRYQVSRWQ